MAYTAAENERISVDPSSGCRDTLTKALQEDRIPSKLDIIQIYREVNCGASTQTHSRHSQTWTFNTPSRAQLKKYPISLTTRQYLSLLNAETNALPVQRYAQPISKLSIPGVMAGTYRPSTE